MLHPSDQIIDRSLASSHVSSQRYRELGIPERPAPSEELTWAMVTTKHTITPPRMQASGVATTIDVAAGAVYIIILQATGATRSTHPPRLLYPLLGVDGHKRIAEAVLLDSRTGDKLYVNLHALHLMACV